MEFFLFFSQIESREKDEGARVQPRNLEQLSKIRNRMELPQSKCKLRSLPYKLLPR